MISGNKENYITPKGKNISSSSNYILHSPIKINDFNDFPLKDITNTITNKDTNILSSNSYQNFNLGIKKNTSHFEHCLINSENIYAGKENINVFSSNMSKNNNVNDYKAFDKFQQKGKKSVKIVNDLINDLDIRFDAIENYQELLTKRPNPSCVNNIDVSKNNFKKIKTDNYMNVTNQNLNFKQGREIIY